MYCFSNFSAFFLWKIWKKSFLNELKFWEASQNYKWSICWNFQLSISLATQKVSHVGIHIWEFCSPLWYLNFGVFEPRIQSSLIFASKYVPLSFIWFDFLPFCLKCTPRNHKKNIFSKKCSAILKTKSKTVRTLFDMLNVTISLSLKAFSFRRREICRFKFLFDFLSFALFVLGLLGFRCEPGDSLSPFAWRS